MCQHTRLLRHTYGVCMDFMQRMTAIYNTQKKKQGKSEVGQQCVRCVYLFSDLMINFFMLS